MNSYFYIKKIFDFLFAIILLIISSPILLLATIAIKLESKGPILFKQNRPGRNTKIFTVYKFRTMRVETEANGKRLSDIERMTKVGAFLRKTSIDELPQLINILKGEMSFIGPRPLLVQYLDYYSEEQMRRHEVTPGISGWAQVNGRNAISWEQKFQLDLYYINNMSFLLDLKIIMLTIHNVIIKRGVNNSYSDTMPYFVGSLNKENKPMNL